MSFFEVKKLNTTYSTFDGPLKAVEDVSFKLKRGKSLGIAGESGCGKSTISNSIMNLLPVLGRIDSGEIYLNGKNILEMDLEDFKQDIRWKKISMVYQGAMNALNPLMKIGNQISEAILFHEQVTKNEAFERSKKLLKMVGIEESRVHNYPFQLSGGMKQRVMIAMALACNPELIIADEPTTALDVIVSRQIINLLMDLKNELNLSLILITHDLSVMAQVCDEILIMYAGKIVEYCDIFTAYKNPVHPYTYLLLSSFPSLIGEKKRVDQIPGTPPSLINPPAGCRFHPRCQHTKEICKTEVPQLVEIEEKHFCACHFAEAFMNR